MKNIALIIAGGLGERTGYDVPKQFITISNKPVIVYTMEVFQKNPSFDSICVVCLDGWHNILRAYAKQYGITKLQYIANAGNVGQESIYNGIMELKKHFSDEDGVYVHDAVRPLLSEDVLNQLINTFSQYGNGVVAIPCTEAVLKSADGISSDMSIPRNSLFRTQTPQAFTLGKLLWAHAEAAKRGIGNSVSTATLMSELGETLYLSSGDERNMKITTESDIQLITALMSSFQ